MANIITFYEDDDRYKCCCKLTHAKTGVLVICVLSLVVMALNVLGLASGAGAAGGGGGGLGFVIGLICICCALYGVYSEKAGFLIPQMVLLGIGIVFLILAGIGVILGGLFGMSFLEDHFHHIKAQAERQGHKVSEMTSSDSGAYKIGIIIGGVIILACAGLEIWFFLIFLAAYRYYKAKATYTPAQQMTTVSGQYYAK